MQYAVSVQARSNFLGENEEFSAVALPLDSLLRYTVEMTEEASVEVSLAAELFKDRLDVHYGLALLRCLACLEARVRPDR